MAALFTLAKENPQLIAETLFPYFNFAVSQLRLNPDTYLMRVEQAALIAHRNQLPDDLLVILTMRGIL
jgi:predicted nucleic acid-binding protein